MTIKKNSQNNSSRFDKLEPKEKLSPTEKSDLADKLLTRFYFCFAIASFWPYLVLRLYSKWSSSEVSSFLSDLWIWVAPAFALFVILGIVTGLEYTVKVYGWSLFSEMQVLGDIRLRHLKPLLIVPIYALLTEVFVRIYF